MKKSSASLRKWLMLIGVSLSSFVAFIDFTIVSAALPTIQKELLPTFVQLEWFMNVFVLVHCILLVVMGDFGDIFGRRRMNYIGMAIFGLSSLFAGLATTPEMFIFWRGVQGGSCAITIPCSLALISATFPTSQRGRAIGIWTSITGIGLAIGPVCGGIFSEIWTWRWIFYVNVPIILVSTAICLFSVDESRNEERGSTIDWWGFLFLALGVGSFVTGLVQGPIWGWTSPSIIALFILAVVGMGSFFYIEHTTPTPIIRFSLFANRMFFSCASAAFTMLFFMWSCFFLMPLYLQNIRGQLPEMVGLQLLPITAIVVILSPIIGKMVDKIGVKIPICTGLLLLAFSAFIQMFFHAHTPLWTIMVAFIAFGIGWGCIFGPMAVGAISSLPHKFAGVASGTLWTIQNIGGAIGLAVAGVVFHYQDRSALLQQIHMTNSSLSSQERDFVLSVVSDPEKATDISHMVTSGKSSALTDLFKNAFMHGYNGSMTLLCILALVTFGIVLLVMNNHLKKRKV